MFHEKRKPAEEFRKIFWVFRKIQNFSHRENRLAVQPAAVEKILRERENVSRETQMGGRNLEKYFGLLENSRVFQAVRKNLKEFLAFRKKPNFFCYSISQQFTWSFS